MSAFEDQAKLLEYRRRTVPRYRDIRDRPTWEVQDTFYWNMLDNSFPNAPADTLEFQDTEGGTRYILIRRILRKDIAGRYTWDGSTISITGLIFSTTNVNGKYNFYEEIRITAPDNSQHINANCLYAQDSLLPELSPLFTTAPFAIFSVQNATGTWTGATNVVVLYNNVTGERQASVLRALN